MKMKMVHTHTQRQIVNYSKLVGLGFLESIAALAYLCTKYTRKASQKLAKAAIKPTIKRLMTSHCNSNKNLIGEESFGGDNNGVWRKTIIMGDKCEPLDFSGVIYYDSDGKLVSEIPTKSPRARWSAYPTAEI